MFPKNAWYVACTADEVGAKPLGRTLCNEKIVFYRGMALERTAQAETPA